MVLASATVFLAFGSFDVLALGTLDFLAPDFLALDFFDLASFPLGFFALASFPLGFFALASFPLGFFALASFPLDFFAPASFPLDFFAPASFFLMPVTAAFIFFAASIRLILPASTAAPISLRTPCSHFFAPAASLRPVLA